MKKTYLITMMLALALFLFTGCEVTPPDPIIIDEDFAEGIIPSNVWTWQSGTQYAPEIVDDGGNKVLKLTSSSEIANVVENQPHYSGFGVNGGPNERPLKTSWNYEVQMKIKIVNHVEGWGSLTFRYYY